MPIDDRSVRAMFDADLAAARDAAGTYVLEIRNPTDYAFHVQHRDGIDIFDDVHLDQALDQALDALPGAAIPTPGAVVGALDQAGHENVAHLRSLTSETTDDGRRMHPGYWADDTGALAQGYEHEARKL